MNSRKFAGYKVNIKNYFAFLHTNNELSERDSKKKINLNSHKKE